MCGIAGIHRRGKTQVKLINRLADSLLLSIAHRGSDATGYLAIHDDGSTQMEKVTDRAPAFVLSRRKVRNSARTILLHTRFATQGRADDPRNAHPVVAGSTAAVHNGTIYNDGDLFKQFEMERTAQVDSIVIPALIDKLGWAKAGEALSKLRGGCATAVVNAEFPTELILARTQSYPMHVLITADVVVWASERASIEAAWKHAYGTKPDGEFVVLPEWTMLHVNGKVTTSKLTRPTLGKLQVAKTSKTSKWPAPLKSKGGWKGHKPTAKKLKQTVAQQLALAEAIDDALDATAKREPPPLWDDIDEPEPYMVQAVEDLQSWAGCSYDEAYEEVYGVSPEAADTEFVDELEWIDDILVPLTKAEKRQADRRADGWEVGL